MGPLRILAAAALLFASACGSEVVGDVDRWADRGCACENTECALEVRKSFTTWVEEKRGLRGSRTEKARIEQSAVRLFRCLDELQAASAEVPPHDDGSGGQ